MRALYGVVALALAQGATAFTASGAFGGVRVAATRAAVASASTLTMKKGKGGDEAAKPRSYVRSKGYKINPVAEITASGVVEMNVKTGKVIKAPPKEVPGQAKPGKLKAGNMELYCKAGANGQSLGDCPFTQYVQMVLHHKGLPFALKPCGPDNKPKWLVEEHEGKMPCLVHDGEAYTDSAEIVRYLEYFFPEPSLAPKAGAKALEAANAATSGLFGVLAKCIKNLDPAADKELVAAVNSELKKVDAFLKKGGGPFLCGKEFTTADCSFAPKLYHAKTTLAQFKNTVIDPDLSALHKYMDTVFAHPAFVASYYPPDVIVWGWNNARGTAAK